jgi:hypothetical protein
MSRYCRINYSWRHRATVTQIQSLESCPRNDGRAPLCAPPPTRDRRTPNASIAFHAVCRAHTHVLEYTPIHIHTFNTAAANAAEHPSIARTRFSRGAQREWHRALAARACTGRPTLATEYPQAATLRHPPVESVMAQPALQPVASTCARVDPANPTRGNEGRAGQRRMPAHGTRNPCPQPSRAGRARVPGR